MHLVIAEAMGFRPQEGMAIDHRNRDSLDNRRANLRQVSISMNNRNRGAQGHLWPLEELRQ